MSNQVSKDLEKLQELVIKQLIRELEEGDTSNISVANTLLTANKVVVKHNEGEGTHSKVKKIMQRKSE